jgi:hypothetical protein
VEVVDVMCQPLAVLILTGERFNQCGMKPASVCREVLDKAQHRRDRTLLRVVRTTA